MKFGKAKKGYDTAEVDKYVDLAENTLIEQKQRIQSLKTQISLLEKEISGYAEKKDLIKKALGTAVDRAEEMESLARQKYNQEIARLRQFHDKWTDHYNKLLKKYPDSGLKGEESFNRQMFEILNRLEKDAGAIEIIPREASTAKIQFETETIRLNNIENAAAEGEFKPVERIKAYLSRTEAESENAASVAKDSAAQQPATKQAAEQPEAGFNFEEALNPKEDLFHIMKDLGLIEEN